ncbi:transposase family protein [Nostoc sp. UHCC 0926]|uniref:transposase family protein n=1 Tax=unclassified Nostoc TaxID=2593658 RepID=UPI00235E96CE|nr:transposase family protein [Nostoc sp. UHCC 0926]WDD31838.1 transposase family protein [Nostoc sp. UHCC 0926]
MPRDRLFSLGAKRFDRRFHSETESLEDSGYQGISKLHTNGHLPQKKPKGGKLTKEQKQSNRALASRRVVIEHVNRRLKVFRILSQRYRNRRKRNGRALSFNCCDL